MEIVIKIDEEMYNQIMNGWMPVYKSVNLMDNIKNGTPLPKGHGNLIDVNEFNKYLISRDSSFKSLLSDIPTIIEADGGRK